jgi:HPt (histidine-containing phosphotransfer) domain-containing protein
MTQWLDRTSIEIAIREDRELMIDLESMFRALQPDLESRIEQAISDNHFTEVREAAHLLKTRLRHLHLPTLGSEAEALERQAIAQNRNEILLSYFTLKRKIAEGLTEFELYVRGES